MKAFCQAGHDILRELIWALLYGFFAALVITSFVFSASGIKEDIKKAKFVSEYKHKGISMLVPQAADTYNVPEDMKQSADYYGAGKTLNEVFTEGFSRGGKLGSKAVLPFPDPELFDEIIIVMGRMVDMTGFYVPQESDMYVAVSKDLERMVGKTFTFDGNEYLVEAAVPEGTVIGSLYNKVDAGDGKRRVIVFVRDYQLAYRRFWYSPDSFLQSLIAVNAAREEKAELLKTVYLRTGTFAELIDADKFLTEFGDAGVKYAALHIAFYAAAAAAVTAAMAMNLARVLRAHRSDYAVNRLFGATKTLVFMRMLFLAVGFNIVPMLYTAKRVMLPIGYELSDTVMSDGKMTKVIMPYSHRTALTMLLTFAAITALTVAVVISEFIAFNKRYSKGVRRE